MINKISQNADEDVFFGHPWRGIVVVLIFLMVAPPMELLLFAYCQYEWGSDTKLLVEMVDIFNIYFLPNVKISYSFFVAQAVLAGLYCAFFVARGQALSWRQAVIALSVLELATEFLIEIITFYFRDMAFDGLLLFVTLLQAIFAASICWLIIRLLKIDQFIILKKNKSAY
ncbi:hypothetical protein N5853_01885 [Bartonella sp. HY329]|uniref:hypothetical protein n=1 Tax=unclassified Bartonella TaxID=2645622 RepID=UPI0021CA4954|nr:MULTISPECIES: hypothetical protein [unclassified Bartonella]UXM95418.1 hypothetical protein N5853_01885 [Bartonella sp. HY329]UXN09743.1 hypothetical protein N5852_01890 [Bartonella sp. HY328]